MARIFRTAIASAAAIATVLALLAANLFPAWAQSPPQPLSKLVGFADPATSVDSDYGRRLIDHMAQIIIASAPTACLAERKLDKAAVSTALRSHLIDWIGHRNGLTEAVIDSADYEQALVARIGAEGFAEWRRILSDPRLVPVRETLAVAAGMHAIDGVVENISRSLILDRVKLTRPLSPIASGESELLLLAEEIAERAQERAETLLRELPRELGQRYRELSEAAAAALPEARPTLWLSFGPRQWVPGVNPRFEAFCLSPR